MRLEIYDVLWLFFIYSFLGWLLETVAAGLRKRKFINRGVIDGPLCSVYGIAAVVLTVNLSEQKESWLVLFIGSAVFSTVIEWLAGHLLEKSAGGKWWDYSNKPFNLDGYICLQYSLLWGVLGALALKFVNPLLRNMVNAVPHTAGVVTLWIVGIIYLIDLAGAYATVLHTGKALPHVDEANSRIAELTLRLSNWIIRHVQRRLQKAYPQVPPTGRHLRVSSTVFAEGCGFYKLVWLFFIGAFLGDITETIFCRLTAGVWMSRSSVVWGPFSIVWGLAIMLATALLHRYSDRSDGFLFLFGTVLGGAYEYFCSVFTEVMFGTVFWDYSSIPFNLGGRINLLYCFFWGFAAVVWLKLVYPKVSRLIEKVPKKPGVIITWALVVFMLVNVGMSGLALARYETRAKGLPAQSGWQEYMDDHFPDARMAKIYPNAIQKK